MNKLQSRDGLPDALIEEKRFFELYGPGKTDTPKGWNTPENWQYLDDIPAGRSFGFALGNNSNYLLIDGDHVRDAKTGRLVPWVADVVRRIREAGDTYTEVSMSGTGFHMICDLGDYAEDFGIESNEDYQKIIQMDPAEYAKLPKDERDKVPKIELFYHLTGRYVYLTGKHDKLRQVARDEEAAEIFRQLIKIRDEFHAKFAKTTTTAKRPGGAAAPAEGARFPLSDRDRERLLDALFAIPADCDRITWVRIGYALFNHGFPFETFDEWSKHPEPAGGGEFCSKYNADEVKTVWKSYRLDGSNWSAGTIFTAAKAAGWKDKSRPAGAADRTGGESGAVTDPGDLQQRGPQRPAIIVRSLEDETEEEHEWLVPQLIPKRDITLLVGDGGTGKTSIWTSIAADISRGRQTFLEKAVKVPEDFARERKAGDVLFFSAEDSVKYGLKAKFRKYAADQARISFIGLEDECFHSIKFNSDALEGLISSRRPALCIFDPLQAFIPPEVQMGARNQMRQCLEPLSGLGQKYGTTFLIVMHTNKKRGVWGRTRCADSADIWDIARSVLIAGETPEKGNFYVSHEKSNYAELAPTILYTLENGIVNYSGTTEKKDRDYMAESAAARPSPSRTEAKEKILELLADGERQTSEFDAIMKEGGTSATTLKRAKQELKEEKRIAYRAEGFGREKVWYIRLA